MAVCCCVLSDGQVTYIVLITYLCTAVYGRTALPALDRRLACLNLLSSVLLLACAGSVSHFLGMLRSILLLLLHMDLIGLRWRGCR